MLACTGNHEIEAESDGKNSMFTSVQARWKVLPVCHGVPGTPLLQPSRVILRVIWPRHPTVEAQLVSSADAFQLQQLCIILLPQRTGGPQPCDQPVPICGLHTRKCPVAVAG